MAFFVGAGEGSPRGDNNVGFTRDIDIQMYVTVFFLRSRNICRGVSFGFVTHI